MIRDLLDEATERLSGSSDSPRLDAQILLAHVLDATRTQLVLRAEESLDEAQIARFWSMLEERRIGVPVAYLIGYRDFWNSRFEVTPAVLIPRPETELLVETALQWLRDVQNPRVLDLGTGSGAIGLSIAIERPDAVADLVDRSAEALAIAEKNRVRLRADNVRTLLGDWFTPVAGRKYDLIVSNPPYIAPGDAHLAALRYEPTLALVAPDDGLADLYRIVGEASPHLLSGGRLLLEHGYDQAAAVRRSLRTAGFGEIRSFMDLGGIERATGGVLPD
jgi:release factor glutamine methyltransferase